MYGSDQLGVNSWRFQLRRGRLRRHQRSAQPRDRPRADAARADRACGRHDPHIHQRTAAARASAPATTAGARRRTRASRSPTRTTPGCSAGSHQARAGTFEASRTIVGPESQMAFDVVRNSWRGVMGPRAAQRAVPVPADRGSVDRATRSVRGGDRFGHHGVFVPGAGNSIGFEDLVTIEDYEFCRRGRRGAARMSRGSSRPSACAAVQAALLRSVSSGSWEAV